MQAQYLYEKSSLQGTLAHIIGRKTVKRFFTHMPLSNATFRALEAIEFAAGLSPTHKGVTAKPISGSGGTSILITPTRVTSQNIIVYFHGGGFMGCGLGTHKHLVERLAIAEGAPVLAVAYRHLPEALLPVTVKDCMKMTEWVFKQGYSSSRVILAGDSAGGALTMLIAGKLHKKGKTVLGAISLSGWLDFLTPQEAYAPYASSDAYIPAKRLPIVAELVLGRKPRKSDSPIHQLTEGHPPVLLIAGAHEVLRVDAETAFARCTELAIPCGLHLYAGGVHAFPVMTTLFPETKAALTVIRGFIETCESNRHALQLAE